MCNSKHSSGLNTTVYGVYAAASTSDVPKEAEPPRTAQEVKVQHALHRIGLPIVEDRLRLLAEYLAYGPHACLSGCANAVWLQEALHQPLIFNDCLEILDASAVNVAISERKLRGQGSIHTAIK